MYSSKDRYLSVSRKQCRWLSKVDRLPKLTTVYTRQFPLRCLLVQNDIDNIEELFESAELVEETLIRPVIISNQTDTAKILGLRARK